LKEKLLQLSGPARQKLIWLAFGRYTARIPAWAKAILTCFSLLSSLLPGQYLRKGHGAILPRNVQIFTYHILLDAT